MKRPEGILDLISTEKPTIYCQNNANIQLHVRSTKTELFFFGCHAFSGKFLPFRTNKTTYTSFLKLTTIWDSLLLDTIKSIYTHTLS